MLGNIEGVREKKTNGSTLKTKKRIETNIMEDERAKLDRDGFLVIEAPA